MKDAARHYQQHMHRSLDRIATWLPADRLMLGDVGIIEDGGFRKQTDLQQLGVPFNAQMGAVQPSLSCTSASWSRVGGGAQGSVPGAAGGGLALSFQRAGAVVFEAQGVRNSRIEDLANVAAHVRALRRSREWERAWALVEQVWTAATATIIVSISDAAQVEVHARAGHALVGIAALADPSADLEISTGSGQVIKEVGARDLTPLYRCSRLRSFGRFRAAAGDDDRAQRERMNAREPDDAEDELARIGLEDLWESWDAP